MKKYKTGIFIGRFQPFHLGHLSAIKQTLSIVNKLIIVIGSANQNFDIKNPLLARERLELIQQVIKNEPKFSEKINNIIFLDDQIDNFLWLKQLLKEIPGIDLISSNNSLIKILAEYVKIPTFNPNLEKRDQFRGEIIRELIINNKPWHHEIPNYLIEYLENYQISKRLQSLTVKDF